MIVLDQVVLLELKEVRAFTSFVMSFDNSRDLLFSLHVQISSQFLFYPSFFPVFTFALVFSSFPSLPHEVFMQQEIKEDDQSTSGIQKFDIAIVGGGLVGMALACSLG